MLIFQVSVYCLGLSEANLSHFRQGNKGKLKAGRRTVKSECNGLREFINDQVNVRIIINR